MWRHETLSEDIDTNSENMKLLPKIHLAFLFSMSVSASQIHRGKQLQVDVYHLPPEPVVYQNTTNLTFSPTSFTLISGKHDAVLVDAPATTAQGQALSDWIASTIPDKTLRAIYITHGHGDHFFTANVIQQAHPGAKVLATAGTADHMAEQYNEPFWDAIFPGKISHVKVVPEILPVDGKFYLEGHLMQGIEVGQGDTWKSTVLHVPDLDLVVGGDVVYGDCHQFLLEDNTAALRKQWLTSLDKVAALQPKMVVPGHQTPSNGYSPSHVEDTQAYIRFYEEALGRAKSWQDLEEMLKTGFPNRSGSFTLRLSSQAPFNATF